MSNEGLRSFATLFKNVGRLVTKGELTRDKESTKRIIGVGLRSSLVRYVVRYRDLRKGRLVNLFWEVEFVSSNFSSRSDEVDCCTNE